MIIRNGSIKLFLYQILISNMTSCFSTIKFEPPKNVFFNHISLGNLGMLVLLHLWGCSLLTRFIYFMETEDLLLRLWWQGPWGQWRPARQSSGWLVSLPHFQTIQMLQDSWGEILECSRFSTNYVKFLTLFPSIPSCLSERKPGCKQRHYLSELMNYVFLILFIEMSIIQG